MGVDAHGFGDEFGEVGVMDVEEFAEARMFAVELG